MRPLAILLVACGGSSTAPLANTNASAPPAKVCSVIPEGKYRFGAAATEDALIGGDMDSGHCSTPFTNGVQHLLCEQTSTRTVLEGALALRGDNTWLNARGRLGDAAHAFEGELAYSDAVVIHGTLRAAGGHQLAIRLELDCSSVDACHEELKNARRCR
jgi:hypothetical protein